MMQICVYTCNMNFREFMNQRYVKWRADKIGAAGSISSWGREMGISPQVLNGWMNRGSVPRADAIAKLADYLGSEVYSVLGMTVSEDLSLSEQLLSTGLDPDWVSAFISAKAAAESELLAKGISANSPEGKLIAKKVFAEYGIDISLTE
jgi:transcriptional regulator with XRE-family HTH domain